MSLHEMTALPTTAAPPAPACAPLVKWVGGKSALIMALHANLPKRFGRYLEPFAGGAALFFSLSPEQAAGAVLSDMNQELIGCYRTVASDTERVIRRLRWMERKYRDYGDRRWYRTGDALKTYYYAVRDQWNHDVLLRQSGATGSEVERAAAFLFLNRTCWNGVWRVNRAGAFNVPQGDYDPTRVICDADKIRAAAARLRQATIRAWPWQRIAVGAREGDLVYFDPPYVPLSATASFTGYTMGGFNHADQSELAGCVHALVDIGVHVLVSNSNTKVVRQLYRNRKLTLRRVHAPRAINCKSDRRGKVRELLIVGPR
jgi:DNA adenine methylase